MSNSDHSRQDAHDPRSRHRSAALQRLLDKCPEHLFSTDESKMRPLAERLEDRDDHLAQDEAVPSSLDVAA